MNAAKIIFDALVSGGEAEVIRLIRNDEPEHLHLDFKTRPQDKDLQPLLGKALSGFANADGGVLVFGVAESSGVRTAEPFDDAKAFEQELNALFSRVVAFPVPGVVTALLASQQLGKAYVAVLVPASDLAPHRSEKDKRYYRRAGDSFYPMEHYDLRVSRAQLDELARVQSVSEQLQIVGERVGDEELESSSAIRSR